MLPTYIPSPSQGVWHLGPLPVRAYALFIIAGIVIALLITDRRWAARGGEPGVVYDIALWAVPFGLVGGRLYHLATDWRTYFGQGGAGLAAALRIWDGGLGIWGAVALGGVGAWIACRRRGIPLPAFGDALAPGLVLAQAIGRLGNYFNQELYGRETTMPWGLEVFYRRDPAGFEDVHSLDGVSTGQLAYVVQPTFLYELIWNVLVFVALIYIDRRFTLGHARLFALYVAGYCTGRFVVELLRDDTATHIAGIRVNSFTSTFVFIGAIVYFLVAPKGREEPASLRGTQAPEPEPATVAAAAGGDAGTAGDAPEPDPETEPDEAEPVEGLANEPEGEEPEGTSAEAETEEAEAPEAEEAGTEEAEVVESEAVEPEVSDAVADEAGAEEPSAEEPQDAEPETEDAGKADEPEDTAEPETEEAEDADEPEDTAEPEIQQAEEAKEPEAPEFTPMEAQVPKPAADDDQADEPDAAEPEEPDTEEPDDAQPETEEPDTEEPDTEVPDTQESDGESAAERTDVDESDSVEPKDEEYEADSDVQDAGAEAGEGEESGDSDVVVGDGESEPASEAEESAPDSEEPADEQADSQAARDADTEKPSATVESRRRWSFRRRSRR